MALTILGNAQELKVKELDYTIYPNPVLITMDTSSNQLIVGTVLEDNINLQLFSKTHLSKIKEINIPAQLNADEQIAQLIILKTDRLSVLLKTFSPNYIYIKLVSVEAPGLIPKPIEVLKLPNKRLSLTVAEQNPMKSVDKQVQIVYSPSKKFISVLNKQSLVCSDDSKGLEIFNFNDSVILQNTFQASNCGLRDLHLFDNGLIALAKTEFKRIELDLYSDFFRKKELHYIFPEIIKRPNPDANTRNDTFDQQVKFYFDDLNGKIYGYINGFVNNNYISHVGLYVYDVHAKVQIPTKVNPSSVGGFLNYTLLYRDFFKGYSYEYPMHLKNEIYQATNG